MFSSLLNVIACNLPQKQDPNDNPLMMFIAQNMPDAKIHEDLTELWYSGYVILSSSGYHAEFSYNELSIQLESYSLLYLSVTQEEATGMIIRLMRQRLYVQ